MGCVVDGATRRLVILLGDAHMVKHLRWLRNEGFKKVLRQITSTKATRRILSESFRYTILANSHSKDDACPFQSMILAHYPVAAC